MTIVSHLNLTQPWDVISFHRTSPPLGLPTRSPTKLLWTNQTKTLCFGSDSVFISSHYLLATSPICRIPHITLVSHSPLPTIASHESGTRLSFQSCLRPSQKLSIKAGLLHSLSPSSTLPSLMSFSSFGFRRKKMNLFFPSFSSLFLHSFNSCNFI